jgi:cell division protein FtsI/penicillin-binding protein 2
VIGAGSIRRLHVVAALCIVPLALVTGRVTWLQIVKGEELNRRAESQHMLRVWIPPYRGQIEDRNGSPLAYTMFNSSIVAEPAKVKNPRKTARTLASALETSPRKIEKLLRTKRSQVYLERRVSPMIERRVDLNSLPGIREELELKRIYPQGEGAAHVIGFLNHAKHGRAGIEAELDDLLRGHPGWATELRDGFGNSYLALGARSKPARPGHDVRLTIDATLQDVVASELREAARRLEARGASFVAVDPRTGEILAMVSWPSYDPERVKEANKDALRNRTIVDPYEPGSTFKLVAAVTALSDGVVKPTTAIYCERGRHNFGSYVISDHHPYETLTFKDCFAVSSNIAFAKVGNLCGTRLYDTARDFGFGSPTGIPLAGEAAGVIHPTRRWSKRSAATLAIGYEVMATPLQMAMAYAAVANDGVLMRPRLIRTVTDPDGKVVYEGRPEAIRRVMDQDTAKTLRLFMRKVMTDGTGSEANLSWVEVGGKTGTSEKFVPGSGYSRSRHYASFVGVAPLENPKIVCFIMIDEPNEKAAFGGSAAAPVFREVLEAFGRLPGAWLGPEYDRVVVETKDPRGMEKLLPEPLVAGNKDGFPGPPSPARGLPDVRGESLRRSLQILGAYGVTAEIQGRGVIRRQTPPPGSMVFGVVDLLGSEQGTGKTVLASGSDALKEEIRSTLSSGSPGWR